MTVPMHAPLEGELLGPGDVVTVIAVLHPFRAQRDVFSVPAGLCLQEITALAAQRRPGAGRAPHFAVSIGSHAVPPDLWSKVRPKAGVSILVRAVPRGGGGTLLRSLAMLFVVILTAFVVGPYLASLGFSAFTVAAVSAVINIGAGLLINALFPVRAKKDKDGGTLYSIGGNSNLATQYEPIPVVIGETRVYPRYAASAHTEFVGNDQYVRLLYCWGYGPLELRDFKLGDTPLSAFAGVQVEHFLGYPDDLAPTLYPSQVPQQDLNIQLRAIDGMVIRTTSEDVTEWAVDLVAPNGLASATSSGKKIIQTLPVHIYERRAYTEAWTLVHIAYFIGYTAQPIRQTFRRAVEKGQYDIGVQRFYPDYDSEPQVSAATAWTALRSYRSDPPVTFRKPVALTALLIRATAQLQGVVDNLNAIASSRGRALVGDEWLDDRKSRNPADGLLIVWRGPANPKPIMPWRIDWDALAGFHAHCVLRAYTFDGYIAERQSVLDMSQDVASAGRGAVVFRDGKWSVVWETADDPIVQHFTTRNSWGFSGRREYRQLPHAFRARFKNEARGWRDDEMVIYADGYDHSNATIYEEVEFPGQTNHELVWRHGRYHLAQLQYRSETIRLNVDIEHLVCTRGDRVHVTHDVPQFGIAGARVVAASDTHVWLDEAITMEAGKDYCVRFRGSDGSSFVRTVQTVPGETSTVTLTGSGGDPQPGDLAMFGELGAESVVLRVKAITPMDDFAAELTLEDDAPQILDADIGDPPEPGGGGAGPFDPIPHSPVNLRVMEGNAGPAGDYEATVTFFWDARPGGLPIDHFEVAVKSPGDSDFGTAIVVATTLRSHRWTELAPGSTDFRVRTFFTGGGVSDWSVTTAVIVSYSAAPPDVAGLQARTIAGTLVLSWEAPTTAVAGTELRYSPAMTGATWGSSTLLVDREPGATSFSTPFAAGTYLAKFKNAGGVYSIDATAAVVASALGSPTHFLDDIFDMAFTAGTHTLTELAPDGGVQLVAPDLDEGHYVPSDRIDLGAVYLVRLSGEIVAHGVDLSAENSGDIAGIDPADWLVRLQIRTTADNPASPSAQWNDWLDLVASDVTARGIEARLVLTSAAPDISPVVEMIHVQAEALQRIEAIRGLAVPAAGASVDFQPDFQIEPSLSVTGRDFVSGDRLDWVAKSAGGFTLIVRNSAGTAVARTADVIAVGYGRKAS